MTEADVPGDRRRRPKDQKRIPLSLRVTPKMHNRLVDMANRHGRSITQQTEFMLERSLDEQHRSEAIDVLFTHVFARLELAVQRDDPALFREGVLLIVDAHRALLRPLMDEVSRFTAFLEKVPPHLIPAFDAELRAADPKPERKSRRR